MEKDMEIATCWGASYRACNEDLFPDCLLIQGKGVSALARGLDVRV